MTKQVTNLSGPAALQKEGLLETPQTWEDGRRLPSEPGLYERWQFDARLEDGSLLLVTFFNKPLLERRAALRPGVVIALIQPDGKKIIQAIQVEPEEYSASTERCYVRIGRSWVRGDSDWNYEMDAQVGSLGVHLALTGCVPPWRPGTGKFVENDQHSFFGWLAAVPHGTVNGFLTVDGKMRPVKGSGYHDHRWGNIELGQVFSHWYLGRAHLEDYTLLFLEITCAPEYGQAKLPALMLSKDSQIITAGTAPIQLVEQDYQPDEGGRSYPQVLQGCQENTQGTTQFVLRDPRMLDSFSLVDFLPTWQRIVGGIITNPFQFNFTTNLALEINLPGHHARLEGQAIYELALLR